MRALLAVAFVLTLVTPAAAKTDAEKAAERAARDSVKAEKAMRADSLARAEEAAKEYAHRPPMQFYRRRHAKQVQAVLVNEMANRGHSPSSISDMLVTFEKRPTGLLSGANVRLESTFFFAESDSGTTVRCTSITMRSEGGVFGKMDSNDMSDKNRRGAREILDRVYTDLLSTPPDTTFAH